METQPGGLAEVGDLHQSSNSATPPLYRNTAPTNFVQSAQRPLTTVFEREQNVEVPEIPDAGHLSVQHKEAKDRPAATVELNKPPSSVEEEEDQIKPSTRPSTEGAKLSQVRVRGPVVIVRHWMRRLLIKSGMKYGTLWTVQRRRKCSGKSTKYWHVCATLRNRAIGNIKRNK